MGSNRSYTAVDRSLYAICYQIFGGSVRETDVPTLLSHTQETLYRMVMLSQISLAISGFAFAEQIGTLFLRLSKDRVPAKIPEADYPIAKEMWKRLSDVMTEQNHILAENCKDGPLNLSEWANTANGADKITDIWLQYRDAIAYTPTLSYLGDWAVAPIPERIAPKKLDDFKAAIPSDVDLVILKTLNDVIVQSGVPENPMTSEKRALFNHLLELHYRTAYQRVLGWCVCIAEAVDADRLKPREYEVFLTGVFRGMLEDYLADKQGTIKTESYAASKKTFAGSLNNAIMTLRSATVEGHAYSECVTSLLLNVYKDWLTYRDSVFYIPLKWFKKQANESKEEITNGKNSAE